MVAVSGHADAVGATAAKFKVRETEHVIGIGEHDERVWQIAKDNAFAVILFLWVLRRIVRQSEIILDALLVLVAETLLF